MRKRRSMFGKLAYGMYVVQAYPNVKFSIHCISEMSKLMPKDGTKRIRLHLKGFSCAFNPFIEVLLDSLHFYASVSGFSFPILCSLSAKHLKM